jgi:hypothetical protein
MRSAETLHNVGRGYSADPTARIGMSFARRAMQEGSRGQAQPQRKLDGGQRIWNATLKELESLDAASLSRGELSAAVNKLGRFRRQGSITRREFDKLKKPFLQHLETGSSQSIINPVVVFQG